jgi:hypothetical protein
VKGSLGTPIATTTFTGAGDPVGFVFTGTGNDVWTADAGLVAADEYAYPAGGSPVFSISGSMLEPISIAVTPVEVP